LKIDWGAKRSREMIVRNINDKDEEECTILVVASPAW
jgi:hypothetical protein